MDKRKGTPVCTVDSERGDAMLFELRSERILFAEMNSDVFYQVPDSEKIADNFVDGSVIKALNRCRNPSHDPSGPYCYAISSPRAANVTKRYCSVRICRSSGDQKNCYY